MSTPIKPADPIIGPPRGSTRALLDWMARQPASLLMPGGPYAPGRRERVHEYWTEVYRLAPLVGIDPAIVVAQGALETGNWGAIPGAGATAWLARRNPGSIGITSTGRPGEPDVDNGHSWKDGTDAARGHLIHLAVYCFPPFADHPAWEPLLPYTSLDPRRSLVPAAWAGAVRTVQDLAGKWAADPDYGAKIAMRGNFIFGFKKETPEMADIALKQVVMAGCDAPVWIPAELAFRQEIVPARQTNQRPGIAFRGGSASAYTQHDTGNPSFGAGAAMHSRYLHNGAEGQQLGYHLTVDDKLLVQMVPLDEVTWHAGDGGGDGNYDSIACELCINSDSDHIASRRYAAIVAAGVMEALGIPGEPVQHNRWSGKDCPGEMRRTGTWPGYLAVYRTARAQMAGGPDAKPEPAYAPAIVLDLGVWDGKDRVLPDGTVMRACRRTITARGTTKRYQKAATDAPSIGPDLNEGEEADIEYVFQAKKGGARWALTSWGTRLRLAHFTPYITIEPKG